MMHQRRSGERRVVASRSIHLKYLSHLSGLGPAFPQAAATFFLTRSQSLAGAICAAFRNVARGPRRPTLPCRRIIMLSFISCPGAGALPATRVESGDVHWQRSRAAPDRIISCFPLML